MQDVRAARQAAGGEPEEAFVRALYLEHGAVLLGYLARLTGDRERAEDLVQETLLRAWRNVGGLAGKPHALRSWLFTVARNLAVDEHRAGRVRGIQVGSEALSALPAADGLDRTLEAWQVAEALATLSGDHRAVLVETYFRGRSVAEAAKVLDVPPGTVKSRTYYALRALRLALEEQGWGT